MPDELKYAHGLGIPLSPPVEAGWFSLSSMPSPATGALTNVFSSEGLTKDGADRLEAAEENPESVIVANKIFFRVSVSLHSDPLAGVDFSSRSKKTFINTREVVEN